MIRFIIIVVVVGGLGAGGFVLWKNNGDVKKAGQDLQNAGKDALQGINKISDEVGGYPDAKTPKELNDLFCKAIKDRDYKSASKYFKGPYAELMNKAAPSAQKLGTALDDVSEQLQKKGVNTDEMRKVLYLYDPFWKDVNGVVSNVGENAAIITIAPNLPKLAGQSYESYTDWKVDTSFMGALLGEPLSRPIQIKAVKVGEVWKFEMPTPAHVQVMVTKLDAKANLYVQKLEILKREVRTEPDTKDNIRKRMKELLEDAAKE